MRYLLCLILFAIVFTSHEAQAQKIVITGAVLEAHSEETIPFANVVIKGKPIAVTADEMGVYRFVLSASQINRGDSLIASAVGFKKMAHVIKSADTLINVNFRLIREDYTLNEVVILAGENPADRIVRKIIKNKDAHDIKESDNYTYQVYNKMELDAADFNADMFEKNKLLRPFDFILDNIDSTSEARPFLPMFLTETLSKYYYQRTPPTTKEIIEASRVSGVENESVTQFLGGMYTEANIYDNFIALVGKNIPSPIGNQAFVYYKFYLLDSATVDNHWCYKLKFKPRLPQENAFAGDFWVADTTFAIKRISMELNGAKSNINFVERMTIFQEFVNPKNQWWALAKSKLIIDFMVQKKGSRIIGRKTTSYSNFLFDQANTEKVLKNKEDIVLADDVLKKDDAFWTAVRPDTLSKNERAIYAMMDTLKEMPLAKTYLQVINTIVTGYYVKGKVEIGPYFSLLSNNQVQGWRLSFGMRSSNAFSTKVMPTVYMAYGFKDKSIKGGADVLWLLSKKPRQAIHAFYKNDLDIASTSAEDFGQDNILAGLYRRNVPQKLTNFETVSVGYERDWKLGWSNKLYVSRKSINPLFNYYYFNSNNPDPKTTLNTTEVQLNTRFAYKEKFLSGEFERISTGSDYPIINLSYTAGIKGVFKSNVGYQRLEMSVYDWFYVGSLGYTSYYLRAGKVWGNVPFLLLENYPGNETFFFNTYSFNRLNEYEFTSDTYANLFVTHHFEGLFFNKIPLLRKLKLREVISGKLGVGSLSAANKARSTDPTGTYHQFDDLLTDWEIQTPTFKKPYIEAGAGIENILRIFRVDAVWRLTYNDRPQRVEVKVGVQLLF